MDDKDRQEEDDSSWLEQSYFDHTNDFDERFGENLKHLRREIYGRLVDDELSNWMIDAVIIERHCRALRGLGHTDYYEDDVLGMIHISNWPAEYVDYLSNSVESYRKLMGKRIGELIARGEHDKILKLSRSLKNVTERLKEVHETECPAEVLIQILRDDYRKNHSIDLAKEELFIELGDRGVSISEKQFKGLLERLDFKGML